MINIALAPDDNYVMPASVALTSILENKKSDIKVYMLSLENHFSPNNRILFQEIAKKYNTCIDFVELKEQELKGYPVLRHGLSAYLRIYAPILLSSINKLLYVDCDIIVDKPLDELYNLDIEGYDMAAVKDIIEITGSDYLKDIGCSNSHYVNTGVLLMNLKSLRNRDILGDTKAYLNKYKNFIRFSDQDILNGIISNILILPPKFNSTIIVWNKKTIINCLKLWTVEEIEEAKSTPVIIHYLSPLKPWHYGTKHPLKYKWFDYKEKSPFKGFKPKFEIWLINYRINLKWKKCVSILKKVIGKGNS